MKFTYKVHSVRPEGVQQKLKLAGGNEVKATVHHNVVELVPTDGVSGTLVVRTPSDVTVKEGQTVEIALSVVEDAANA